MIRIKTYRWQELLYYLIIIVLIVLILGLAIKLLTQGVQTVETYGLQEQAVMDAAQPEGVTLPAALYASVGEVTLQPQKTEQEDTPQQPRGFLRSVIYWLTGLDFLSPANMLGVSLPAVQAAQQHHIVLSAQETEDVSYPPEQLASMRNVVTQPQNGRPSIEIIGAAQKPAAPPDAAHPRVLLYSTHTHEAYTMTSANTYAETEKWRTADNTQNIVKVGAELKRLLEQKGIATMHDITDHEPPRLGTSYTRSLTTLKNDLARYPSIQLSIDLHRDAYIAGEESTVTINGQKVARFWIIIGTGAGSTGSGFSVKPDWKKNLAFAEKLKEKLDAVNPMLCKPVDVRTGRYNQHAGGHCILIEIGHNLNTLEEALASLPYLADALAQILPND